MYFHSRISSLTVAVTCRRRTPRGSAFPVQRPRGGGGLGVRASLGRTASPRPPLTRPSSGVAFSPGRRAYCLARAPSRSAFHRPWGRGLTFCTRFEQVVPCGMLPSVTCSEPPDVAITPWGGVGRESVSAAHPRLVTGVSPGPPYPCGLAPAFAFQQAQGCGLTACRAVSRPCACMCVVFPPRWSSSSLSSASLGF